MNMIQRIGFIGNSLPRRCGIATFTSDLSRAISLSPDRIETGIVAMRDGDRIYSWPPEVKFEIRDNIVDDYERAADHLNAGRYDIVSLQHEFGIFGGQAGSHVMALLSHLRMPIVTTFHTVLSKPDAMQRMVMEQIATASSRVVVMAEKGRELLQTVYQVPASKIDVIAHGIPDVAFSQPDDAKAKLGFSGKSVILTFGLLSPNKGIEVVIDAMPAILRTCPDAVYVVLGATHPNLMRDEGEAYRESLQARAKALGVDRQVIFLNEFVDQARLLVFIAMCDVYVTPYLNEMQMTSGTLAYSFGLGKAVVSTPYWHARELLDDGLGILVPFADPAATGAAIARVLGDPSLRQDMRERAYESSRSMTWERTAGKYLATFNSILRGQSRQWISAPRGNLRETSAVRPDVKMGYFLSMCDDTGILQHAVHSVPDRTHGYCVDDNARALLLACTLGLSGEKPMPDIMTARFAAFVQHAWNPDTGRFRNFMSFGRQWLEDQGSEDSHGRTLWALGACASNDTDAARRRWAAALFSQALTAVAGFTSPRAWAFTLLGLDPYCAAAPQDSFAADFRVRLANRLLSRLSQIETKDRPWFEEGLTYDNARLPQALILTGMATGRSDCVDAGLRSLAWLMTQQTAPRGHFRPVGTDGFFDIGKSPRPFDQQPLEATATISACLAAWNVTGDNHWRETAFRTYGWFTGDNDLSISLVDAETGSCRDGLHNDRANENRGAESVLCYLISCSEIRHLYRSRKNEWQGNLIPVAAVSPIKSNVVQATSRHS